MGYYTITPHIPLTRAMCGREHVRINAEECRGRLCLELTVAVQLPESRSTESRTPQRPLPPYDDGGGDVHYEWCEAGIL